MRLLNRLRCKKNETVQKAKEQTTTTPQPTHHTNAQPPPGRGSKCILLRENQSMNNAKLLLPGILLLPLGAGDASFLSSPKRPENCDNKSRYPSVILKIENFYSLLKNCLKSCA